MVPARGSCAVKAGSASEINIATVIIRVVAYLKNVVFLILEFSWYDNDDEDDNAPAANDKESGEEGEAAMEDDEVDS